ncbi:MAG TPA: type II toxin-antitoxin system VapC family toxin [Ramlibacter sp.]|nr:type II toxin-antitoxin system VapC family toxin [Ramlibacter sp.]
MRCVVDSSFVLAIVCPDEATPASAEDVLEMDLVAPWLWATEVAAAAQRIERRRRFEGASALQLCSAVEAIGVVVEPPNGVAAGLASPLARLKLAEAHHLTPCDGAYLEMALHRGLPLATQDRHLIAAAERAGIPVYA